MKDSRPKQDELRNALQRSPETGFVIGASAKWGRTFEKVLSSVERVDGDIDVNNLSNAVQRYPVFMARTIGSPTMLPSPPHPFPQQLLCLQQQSQNCKIKNSKAYYHPITQISSWVSFHWLAPWIDYSIAMSEVFKSVSAQDFLRRQTSLENSIVLLIPSEEFDDFARPRAMIYHSDDQETISYRTHLRS